MCVWGHCVFCYCWTECLYTFVRSSLSIVQIQYFLVDILSALIYPFLKWDIKVVYYYHYIIVYDSFRSVNICLIYLGALILGAYILAVVILLCYIFNYLLLFSCSVLSDSLWPHGLQHARPPCPSPNPGAYSNSCPLSQWCHPTISSSVIAFPSHLQSFPASGCFPMSQFFASGGQSNEVSASASVPPMNIQDLFPLGWTGWISLQSKGFSRVFSNTTVQKHQFFGTQFSSQSNSHIHTWLLKKPYLWLDGPLLAK